MMKRINALAFAALLLLVSCIHEFPVPKPADVNLTLTFELDFPYYKTVQFPAQTKADVDIKNEELYAQDLSDHASYDVRYIIEAYRMLADGSYGRDAAQRWVFTDEDASQLDEYKVKISIDEGKYLFRAWADYVLPGTSSDYFYITDDWKKGIRLNLSEKYHGNTDWRDAFVGTTEVEVIRYGSEIPPVSGTIEMGRIQGKYFFLTNDLEDFITKVQKTKAEEAELAGITKVPEFNIDDYVFEITYSSFLPNSFNVFTDRANDASFPYTFKAKLKQIDTKHAIMGFDYVLTPAIDDTDVKMQLILKDKDGVELARHTNVNVPVKRNHYTLVEGRFLMQESSGGVSIDPGFNGPDIVVPVY